MKKIYIRDISITLLTLILIFQNWLLKYFNFITAVDEIIALLGIMLYMHVRLKTGKILKKDLFLLIPCIILILIGLGSNTLFKIQNNKIAVIFDIVGIFKFLFLYLGFKEYTDYKERKYNMFFILQVLVNIIKIYILILCVFAVMNLFKDIDMNAGVRYGLRSFAFIYGTPGHIINQMTYCLIIFGAYNDRFNKKNNIWILMILFVMISTLKTRAFVLVSLYIYLNYIFIYKKKRKLGIQILIISIIAILVGFSQFEFYFLESNTPRQAFLLGAIKFAKEYFPFGTGFATYGSSGAADYYSPLYYDLGFNIRYGMSPSDPAFLNDNYLPMILAQFGIIGTIIFVYLLVYYIIDFKKYIIDENSQVTRCMGYFFIIDVLFSSIQSSYLAHYSVITLSFLMYFFFLRRR